MHIIFTPKGQKIRDPLFGTDLIRYIFEQNDDETWEGIKSEIKQSVLEKVPNVKVNNVSVARSENDEHKIFVRIDYSAYNGITSERDSIAVQI